MGRTALIRARNFLRKFLDTLRPDKTRYCVVCDSAVASYFAYRGGRRAPLIVAMETVGNDVDNFGCPHCNSHDRERHLFLYLQAEGLVKPFVGAEILHFAPETHLAKLLKSQDPSRHIKADLHPTSNEYGVNLREPFFLYERSNA